MEYEEDYTQESINTSKGCLIVIIGGIISILFIGAVLYASL